MGADLNEYWERTNAPNAPVADVFKNFLLECDVFIIFGIKFINEKTLI